MKLRAFFLSALLICGISATIMIGHASMRVEDSKSIEQALKRRDSASLIKSLILEMKEKLEVNADRFPELIKEVESYANSDSDSIHSAILHSMTAEMYHQYYSMNRWTIDQRSELNGYIPDDIREWTANIFKQKIDEELALSLKPASLLQQTTTNRFNGILKVGKDSRELRPTLYEFLAFRAIEISPSTKIYKDIIAFQNSSHNTKGLIITELNYLRYLYGDKSDIASIKSYGKALDELYRELSSQDQAAEILISKLDMLNMSISGKTSTEWDSIYGEQIKLCDLGIKHYPNYPRTELLRNHKRRLEAASISASNDLTIYPGRELEVSITYRNIKDAILKIYRSELNPVEMAKYRYRNGHEKRKKGELVKEMSIKLNCEKSYVNYDTIVGVTVDEPGIYEYEVSASGKYVSAVNIFTVSRITAVHRHLGDKRSELFVTDMISGKPIKGAKVLCYTGTRDKLQPAGSTTTDNMGLAILTTKDSQAAYRITMPGDEWMMPTFIYQPGDRNDRDSNPVELSIFTDRGIYRPGQTIFFKGIAYVRNSDKPHTVSDKIFRVSLYDPNGKEIAFKELKSNGFGSFNGEFTIPKGTLNGVFRLRAGDSQAFINVEEYKRPTFKAEIMPLKDEVSFGDLVTLRGKAETFSGIALPDGNVTWRVNRRPFLWWRTFGSATMTQVAEGESIIDANGEFTMSFRAEKDYNDSSFFPYQTYELTAVVTDSKGETQETRYSFSVGESSVILSINIPSECDKEYVDAKIEAHNINGEPTKISGSYRIVEQIYVPVKRGGGKSHKDGNIVASGNFTSGEPMDQSLFKKLPSGLYEIVVEAKDSKGRVCKNSSSHLLYSAGDKRPPIFSNTWLLEEKSSCLPGEEAEILFGTSHKGAYILYEWFVDGKPIHKEILKMSEENRRFKIPFKSEYGDGMVVSFTMIKEGAMFNPTSSIRLREVNRQLTIKPMTFRDKILPGGSERWSFRVTDTDSAAVSAELLASMYDASLDKIRPFNWNFSPERFIEIKAPRFITSECFRREFNSDQEDISNKRVAQYEYDQFNWFDLFNAGIVIRGFGSSDRVYATGRLMKSAAPSMSNSVTMADNAILAEEEVMESARVFEESSLAGQENGRQSLIRENFAETAFFYPTLRTNSEGEVFVDFTLPESNTTWKLQLLASSDDLKYGLLTKEIISNKPLMVLPNLPRFIREGDEVSISTQVINNSDKRISGLVRIELFDPATDQPIICLSKGQRPFELEADSSTTVSWHLPALNGVSLIGLRIVANSDIYEDGEQHILPLLPDKILVTESRPFYMLKDGNMNLNINDEKDGSKPFRLTIELTSNPIWYAVQALPTISTPNGNDALSWFASYYSNTLAGYIAKSNPKIQKVIAQWSANGGDASTLISNLEKNEELKEILLEETPWVLEGKNESEQKRRLALLFDFNRSEAAREVALKKLIELQEENGGWSWFKGFPASRGITLSILHGMARLVELNAIQYGGAEKEMQIKALNYLDKSIERDYKGLKEHNKSWQKSLPSSEQLEYLFVRSYYRDIPEYGSAMEAIRFYSSQAERNWLKFDLKGKAELAMLTYRNGKRDIALSILTWLRSRATVSEEMGFYWANNRDYSNWLSSPISIHCLLMRAFSEISPNRDDTDAMKRWLLSKKRTQRWESLPATVDAIQELLMNGSDWLSESNRCVVEWGGSTISSEDGELGTGYIKRELDTDKGEKIVKISKEGDTPAWGAIYSQYLQDIDKIEKDKGVLNVEKMLFVETNNGSNRQIRPITDDLPLRVGDKVIVRLTVRSDMDMEYVYLKDMRAGCFEPANQISGTEMRDGIWYYKSAKDLTENFFISNLPKGTFVLEYPVYVSRDGEYAGGIATIQSLYAPEFISHTAGGRLKVVSK